MKNNILTFCILVFCSILVQTVNGQNTIQKAIDSAIANNTKVGRYYKASISGKKDIEVKAVKKYCKDRYSIRNIKTKNKQMFGTIKTIVVSFEFADLKENRQETIIAGADEKEKLKSNAEIKKKKTQNEKVSQSKSKQVTENQELPDERLKGTWMFGENSVYQVNIQNNNRRKIWFMDEDKKWYYGKWGTRKEGEEISFYMAQGFGYKYMYGFNSYKFIDNNTLEVTMGEKNEQRTLYRQPVDYLYEDDDQPMNHDRPKINLRSTLIGSWVGYKSRYKVRFNDDGTLYYFDKDGMECSGTWKLGAELPNGNIPIEVSDCMDRYKSMYFENNSQLPYYMYFKFINSDGKDDWTYIKKIKDNDLGGLSQNTFDDLRNFFEGTWHVDERGQNMFDFIKHGVELNSSGQMISDKSKFGGGFSSSLFGEKGSWSIFYDSLTGKQTIYLDIKWIDPKISMHPQIRRYAINLKSLTDKTFVAHEVDSTIESPYMFRRINSFDELYDAGDERSALLIMLGVMAAQSIIEGDLDSGNQQTEDMNTKRIMRNWREQDAKERGY